MEAMDGAEGASDVAKQKPVTNAGRQYYFVSIKVDADTGVTSAAERSPFVGLQIGLLLGKGAYGRVYKGYYHGTVVAVKVGPTPFAPLLGSLRNLMFSRLCFSWTCSCAHLQWSSVLLAATRQSGSYSIMHRLPDR